MVFETPSHRAHEHANAIRTETSKSSVIGAGEPIRLRTEPSAKEQTFLNH